MLAVWGYDRVFGSTADAPGSGGGGGPVAPRGPASPRGPRVLSEFADPTPPGPSRETDAASAGEADGAASFAELRVASGARRDALLGTLSRRLRDAADLRRRWPCSAPTTPSCTRRRPRAAAEQIAERCVAAGRVGGGSGRRRDCSRLRRTASCGGRTPTRGPVSIDCVSGTTCWCGGRSSTPRTSAAPGVTRVGKSTLFGVIAGIDKDFTGDIIFKRGVTVVSTAQEHHDMGDTTVLQYVLQGLPNYADLSHIIETYPEKMGDDMKLIDEYTNALPTI